MADAARLHLHEGLARAGVGDVDGLERDWLALAVGHDGLDLMHGGQPTTPDHHHTPRTWPPILTMNTDTTTTKKTRTNPLPRAIAVRAPR